MLNLLKKKTNRTYTENGAVTLWSTGSCCVDMFSRIGAMRSADEREITDTFAKAYIEDPDLAMKILFYARDVRGGLGERRVFRVIMKWLVRYYPETVIKNIAFVPEYGRYDDLIELADTDCRDQVIAFVREQLEEDLAALEKGEAVSLLAKWLPSVNASGAETVRRGKLVARALGMSDAKYRKTLSRLRAAIRIIENNLREKDYSFDYEKQPSKAMFKYREAFIRNDHDRYTEFLGKVRRGQAKLNTSTLMPYDIIAPIVDWDRCGCSLEHQMIDPDQRLAIDTSWDALEDFADDSNALAVIDSSGSMYGGGDPLPAAVAVSLGLYFAERNKGAFRNHFITFSSSPQLVEIRGKDIVDKTLFCESFNEVANTDIQKVFELILETAVENRLPQSQLPSTLYIISDMEFDYCTRNAEMTNFEYARKLFISNGYRLPQLVFWNVQSRNRQVPVTVNEQGVVLVSGCTPRIFSMAASGDLDPYEFMMKVIESGRYDKITA